MEYAQLLKDNGILVVGLVMIVRFAWDLYKEKSKDKENKLIELSKSNSELVESQKTMTREMIDLTLALKKFRVDTQLLFFIAKKDPKFKEHLKEFKEENDLNG